MPGLWIIVVPLVVPFWNPEDGDLPAGIIIPTPITLN